jgi:hypothetical protein
MLTGEAISANAPAISNAMSRWRSSSPRTFGAGVFSGTHRDGQCRRRERRRCGVAGVGGCRTAPCQCFSLTEILTSFLIQFFKQLIRPRDRHCEPTGRANARPMTGSTKQSISQQKASRSRKKVWIASWLPPSLVEIRRTSRSLAQTLRVCRRQQITHRAQGGANQNKSDQSVATHGSVSIEY